jgi:hypothetical protein
MRANPQFVYQMPINTNDKEMISRQDIEGRKKESCLQRADQTGRSNRAAGFALGRASVSRKMAARARRDVVGFRV